EEALRIRERDGVESIVAVTIGGDECAEQIRTTLGMGADRAIHVQQSAVSSQESDRSDLTADRCNLTAASLAMPRILEPIVRRDSPDLVLMGKQAIDDDANQAGQMLA